MSSVFFAALATAAAGVMLGDSSRPSISPQPRQQPGGEAATAVPTASRRTYEDSH